MSDTPPQPLRSASRRSLLVGLAVISTAAIVGLEAQANFWTPAYAVKRAQHEANKRAALLGIAPTALRGPLQEGVVSDGVWFFAWCHDADPHQIILVSYPRFGSPSVVHSPTDNPDSAGYGMCSARAPSSPTQADR